VGANFRNYRRQVARETKLEKKDVIFDERSHYVYENKQSSDILPTQNEDIFVQFMGV
jgi:hypothetical protein